MRFHLALAAVLMFAVSACAQVQSLRNGAAEPERTADGFYRIPAEGEWCGEFCDLGRHYVHPNFNYDDGNESELELRATPALDAPVIDRLTRGEFVRATQSYVHTKQRGVVREAGDDFEVGAVAYFLHNIDDGRYYWLWSGGEMHQIEYWICDAPDDPPECGIETWIDYGGTESRVYRWLFIEREDGRPSGWVVNTRMLSIERAVENCTALDLSEICRLVRSRAEPVTATFRTPRPFTDCEGCPSMVRIPGQSFAVGQYEVTLAQWDDCIEAGACEQRFGNRARDNIPASNVTWNDAQAYVQWLSQRTGHRYRLLTTDEWMMAAFPGGRRQNYSWGNDRPTCEPGARNGAAFDACVSNGWPLAVGTFQPNAYGLYDTIGNVGEWLDEPYNDDGSDPDFKAIIGSSIRSSEESLGGRGGARAGESGVDTGFRVARDR